MKKHPIPAQEAPSRCTITMPKVFSILVCVLLIVLSVTVVNGCLSSPQFHSKTIQVLEEQKTEALTLSVAVTTASTVLSALPDDTASSIANELANLSGPLFLIVAVIYLELFLLTALGQFSAVLLFPAACVLMIGFILWRKDVFFVWFKKLFILSLACSLLIPTSASITTHIEETFSETVNQKLHAASHIANAAESEKDDHNGFFSFFSGLADNVTALVDAAKNMLSTLIDAVAILLITSCVMPLLTLFLFLKIVKAVLSIDIPFPFPASPLPPASRHSSKPEVIETADP